MRIGHPLKRISSTNKFERIGDIITRLYQRPDGAWHVEIFDKFISPQSMIKDIEIINPQDYNIAVSRVVPYFHQPCYANI
jgi:hypothetical protein